MSDERELIHELVDANANPPAMLLWLAAPEPQECEIAHCEKEHEWQAVTVLEDGLHLHPVCARHLALVILAIEDAENAGA